MTDAPFTETHHATLERSNQMAALPRTRLFYAIDAALAEIDRLAARANNLQHELLDLITLIPDSQTQEIIDYILSLREIRKRRDEARDA